ncbi:MAG TPA: DUF1080 domain-containing protein [Pirellulales bacterium]|nr:DUF1080 domain-containing protein [Pirellulales bacterium]
MLRTLGLGMCMVMIGPMAAATTSAADASADGWIQMFDGKTLDGWKANENPECWTVEDGTIKGSMGKSHLFYMVREFTDCEFKADIKLAAGSNSGMYFRTAFGPGFPKGYEAQVNNSHKDPKRTGSLYNFVAVGEQLVPDDTWWTQHITVKGNHIVIKVNDKVVVDFVDEKNTYTKGYLALQQHDPKSTVWYKNLYVKPLD